MTVTIYDVAREAGVSMATVSRVVNKNQNVKHQTKLKVDEAIEKLGYRPNAVARGLASKKTTTVGVVIPDISNLNYAGVTRGIDDIADMYGGYNIILSNSDKSQERELSVIETLLMKQVDGVLFLGGVISEEHVLAFQKAKVPVVLCGTTDGKQQFPSVDIDHAAAAYDAVQLLTKHNHTRIAMITCPLQDPSTGYARFAGYKKALENANLPFDESLVRTGKYTYDSGIEAMKYFLSLPERPTAVFAANDEMAVGAIHGIQDAGLNVPGDISVISVDNGKIASMVRPLLTSVGLPLYDIGAVSMRLLTKMMKNEKIESYNITLSHELMIRNSVGEKL